MPDREPLRRVVLPPLPGDATALLGPPRLPPAAGAAVSLARRTAPAALPVLLSVPAAGGRLLVARALHAAAGHAGPLLAVRGRRPPLGPLPAGAALYVDDVAVLAPEVVLALEALLDDGAVWVLAGVEPGAVLPARLGTRLGAVVIAVPPLGERAADLPALAAETLARIARRAGRPVARLTAAAVAHLAARPWPGDLAELEAVLAHALLAADADTIDASHLPAAPAGSPSMAPPAPAPQPSPGPALEFLLAELAHELRNPMVTIKTYAHHLPQLLEDAELRARFATLCDEAIGRMDGLLENVLAFARLPEPQREPVLLAAVLDRVLAEVEPELAGRCLYVRRPPDPEARCAADPEHLAYALKNLFMGVAREVPAREELVLDAAANGVVTLRFATGTGTGAAERLRRLTAPNNGATTPLEEAATLADPTLLPLAFRLARAVLERNGGTLAVVPEDETTTVVVRLPTAHPAAGR